MAFGTVVNVGLSGRATTWGWRSSHTRESSIMFLLQSLSGENEPHVAPRYLHVAHTNTHVAHLQVAVAHIHLSLRPMQFKIITNRVAMSCATSNQLRAT